MAIDGAANVFMTYRVLQDYYKAEAPSQTIVLGTDNTDVTEIGAAPEKRSSTRVTTIATTLLFMLGCLLLNPGAKSKSLDCSRYQQDPAWQAYGEVLKQDAQVGLGLIQSSDLSVTDAHAIINCAYR